ncbi:flavin monoamine oxidase family protein [Altericista sp. CCNU0014]|uniref:flavin monoamine oxidase family protein n=1 Tax=Altericista sp. CCNU0014 TaxID=3082949 RepID=UPI00384B8379
MAHTPLFRKLVRALQEARRLNLQAEGKPLPVPKSNLRWTRRRFVRSLTLASASALASGSLTRMGGAWSREKQPAIAIIGAGLAGLNAAYRLKKAGIKATVYEASTRLGGRVRSVRDALGPGLVSDLGGTFVNTDHEDMLALVKEFNLKLFDRSQYAKQFSLPTTAYFFNDRLQPEAEIAEKLRALASQIGNDAALLDRDFEKFAPQFDRLSVAQYLDRHADKIPEPLIRRLIENTVRSEFGVEPSECSALQYVQLLPTVEGQAVNLVSDSDEAFTVEGGSGKIIEGLAAALPGQIQTKMQLTGLQAKRSGFRLTFANQSAIEADYVIIAIPFSILRTVDLQVALPPTLKRFIAEGNLGRNDKLFAGFSQKVWERSGGFTDAIWTDLGFTEAWDDTQRQTDRKEGALNFYFGGNEVKALETGSTRAAGRQFLERFEAALPGAQSASTGKFLRTQWSSNPLSKGAYANFRPGQLTAFQEFFYVESDEPSERQDVRVGNLIFAGEHLSDEFYGYMNGAAQTGRLAARAVLDRIAHRKGR